MNRSPLLLVAAVLSLCSACRKGAEAWSCTTPQRNACSEWSGADADEATRAKQQASCTGMGGTVVKGPCPDANAIGACTAAGGGGSRIVYYSPRPVADAQRACAMLGGTWR